MEFAALAVWIALAFLGAWIGSQKSAAISGLLLGLLFGPLGVIVACFVDGRPQCPYCFGKVEQKATTCQHCTKAIS